MEHIFEEDIDTLFSDFTQYQAKNMYFLISTVLAKTLILEDVNAHVCVHSPTWWVDKFKNSFKDYKISYNTQLISPDRKLKGPNKYPKGTKEDIVIIKLTKN